MKKELKIVCAILGIVIILGIVFFIVHYKRVETCGMKYTYFNNEIMEKDIIFNKKQDLSSLPKNITAKEAEEKGYFVYDGVENKVYNKDILDRFIKNTEINAMNRVADEIMIVVYGIEGYSTIYDLEYRTDINKYILTADTTRNNAIAEDGSIIPKEIITDTDIPGDCYGITLTEYPGVNATSISLSVYKDINSDEKQYKNIEIARYLLDAEIINK